MRRRAREGALTEVLRALGNRLRDMRVVAGMTQEQVASALDVSTQAVRNWEMGRHEPTVLHLYRMAELYQVSIAEIQEPVFGSSGGLRTTESSAAPIQGYLLAGSEQHIGPQDLGVPVPAFIMREHPNVFGLLVAGNSLAVIGIRDGDLVLVDPDIALEGGAVHIFQVDNELFARRVEAAGSRWRLMGINQDEEELKADQVEHRGKLVWHVRRM